MIAYNSNSLGVRWFEWSQLRNFADSVKKTAFFGNCDGVSVAVAEASSKDLIATSANEYNR